MTFDIPAFLIVDAAVAARRKANWEAHPPQPAVAFGQRDDTRQREVDTARARIAEEEAEDKKRRDASTAERRKLQRAAEKDGVFVSSKHVPGTEWDAQLGRWTKPTMTQAKFERLFREMPDAKHRKVLIEMYGKGREIPSCEVTASSSTPAATASTVRVAAAGKPRSKTAKSSSVMKKVAAPSTHTSYATAMSRTGLPRVPKEEQVAHIKTMLCRPEGTTLAEAGAKFGWQEHSTSAFISVNFRNQGMATTKEKVDGRGTVYRLAKEK